MPILSSGLNVYLSINNIMEPNLNWFKAPDGHFWYQAPHKDQPPPYKEEGFDKVGFGFSHAPVPQTREEMKEFVNVCFLGKDEKIWWQGDYLSDFPFFATLDKQDLNDWHKWLEENENELNDFLDEGLRRCATQAEIMKDAQGYAVVTTEKDPDDDSNNTKYLRVDNPLEKKQ